MSGRPPAVKATQVFELPTLEGFTLRVFQQDSKIHLEIQGQGESTVASLAPPQWRALCDLRAELEPPRVRKRNGEVKP